ncbi:hypothetical protein QBC34DRAFT_151535 [Podospora aff. communis PSN243]|uniref:GIY-YIG domain-containing protein n=1 Tax=Podospora aff. communis PSN243 TaxID=3040156 RepID=A0AAV9GFH0_9PEZI|nr:hypothetical protein QBC34DRAFT_151535 [Podospora aff. communis PSN243]
MRSPFLALPTRIRLHVVNLGMSGLLRKRTRGGHAGRGTAIARAKRTTKQSSIPTIEYQKLFEERNPRHRRRIFWYPPPTRKTSSISPGWYTLHCKEHSLYFGANGAEPLNSARRHIAGSDHGHMHQSHDNAVETLGVLVLNCDASKAERNNALLPQESHKMLRSTGDIKTPELEGEASEPDDHLSEHGSVETGVLVDPEVGKPYVILNKEDGWNWVVMVLPVGGHFTKYGVHSNFDDTLGRDPPQCYKRGPDGRIMWANGRLQWADGYHDGQPLAHRRLFPIRYFNKPPHPARTKWVLGEELRPFEPNNPDHRRFRGSKVARIHYATLEGRSEEAQPYIPKDPKGTYLPLSMSCIRGL